ncbi:hypothetical protein BH24ACT5_BH24ACT5_03680 [soil metagenome]
MLHSRRRDGDEADQALTRAGAVGALVGLVPYLGALWDWGLHPLRQMSAIGTNANFYDLQARALFHGRLDVPPGSLGIEAFVVEGHHYMYFGPFPALLRMPLLAVTDRFDGRLTTPSMLVGWGALAIGLIALMRIVRVVVAPGMVIGRAVQVGAAAVTATILGGSSLVFLASQPWVYHEVYVWSAAGSVATLVALVHLGVAPTSRAVLVAVGAGLVTMLTRAPAGWALAAATIVTGGWLVVRSRRPDGPASKGPGLAVIAGGVANIVIGAGVNWAKFRHPFLFPIQDQVWSQLSAHRQVVLAFNHGRLDGPRFVWSTLTAYFRPDGVRFTAVFPFVWTPARPPSAIGGVRLDESFRTGSVPALMPLLFLPTLWAAVVAFRPRPRGGPTGTVALRLPLLGAAAATGGVMAFGYIAPRYLAEFLPVLVLGSFVGLADIARRVSRSSGVRPRVAVGVLVVVGALAAYGVVANSAIALVNARENWRGDRLETLVSWQERVSALTGHPLREHVHEVDDLPPWGTSDDYYVVGDCQALYVATGERAGAWVPVQTRPVQFRVVVGDAGLRPGSARLMWFPGFTLRRLNLQANLDGQVRLTLVGAPPDSAGRWLDVVPGDVITVSVTSDTARNRYLASATVERGGALEAGRSNPSTNDTATAGEAEEALEAGVLNPFTDEAATAGHQQEASEAGVLNPSTDDTATAGHQQEALEAGLLNPFTDDTATAGHQQEALEAGVLNPSVSASTAAEGSASDEADAARGQSAAEAVSGSDLEAAGAASVRGGDPPQADAAESVSEASEAEATAAEGSASDEAEAARGQSAAAAEPASSTEAEPARSTVSAPMSEWDRRFDSVPIGAVVTLASDADLAALGVTASATWGPVPDLCARLRS